MMCGIISSYPSPAGTLESIVQFVKDNPMAGMHDNVNIAYKKSSQRIDNQNHFDNGTASTILQMPPQVRDILENEHLRRAMTGEDRTSPLPSLDTTHIMNAAKQSQAPIHKQHIYHTIQFLLRSPAFKDYSYLTNASLRPPPPVNVLPHGAAHRTRQMPLGTTQIDESSFEGNNNVITDVLRQVGLSSVDERIRLAVKRVIPWIGDQKTIKLLRGLQSMRGREMNGYDRMDYLLLILGWFHVKLNIVNSIFWTHRGIVTGTGLARDISKLTRIGLAPKTRTSGKPDFHNLQEVILHVLNARIIDCWTKLCGHTTLEAFAASVPHPDNIAKLAEHIVNEYASTKSAHIAGPDETFRNASLFMRDALIYMELVQSIKLGDVGRMENLIPSLLFMCAGGRNPLYAIEFMEMLDNFLRWPAEIK